jgi:hypothetical protein
MLSSGQADLNLVEGGEAKQTPLMIAYNKKYWEIFELLLKNGANVNKSIIRDICVRGNDTALSILQRYFNNKSLACMIFEESTPGNSHLYMAMKYSDNLEFVSKLFEIGVKLNKTDLLDYYSEMKMFKYLSKTITTNTYAQYFNKFVSHVELVILMFKYYSFSEQVLLPIRDEPQLAAIFAEFNLNYGQIYGENKSNVIDYVILSYVSLVFDIYAHLLTLKMKTEASSGQHLKSRLNFIFALVVFSSQLDCRKQFVYRWFEAKFLGNSRLMKVSKMFAEATSAPWSLQALCRSTIRTKINNIDYVLNDKSLIKNLNLPEIYVRYLKFEFI